VTLDVTLNPDFAQVEADQLVVTANQRFPVFYEEKRPFFLEGIDIFKTPIKVMHTRTIVDPDFAAKLTGKRGRNTFPFLVHGLLPCEPRAHDSHRARRDLRLALWDSGLAAHEWRGAATYLSSQLLPSTQVGHHRVDHIDGLHWLADRSDCQKILEVEMWRNQ